MDLFSEWLVKKDSKWVKIALADKSYKKCFEHDYHEPYKEQTNEDLATLGDAVIKLCYTNILFGKEKLSEKRSCYESDDVFVSVIAKHYKILKDLKYDKEDENLKTDYNYEKGSSKGNEDSKYKYIATAVEAMIGAIYKSTDNLNAIQELLKNWIELIDNEKKQSD